MKKGEVGCFLSHYKIWQKVSLCELSSTNAHFLCLSYVAKTFQIVEDNLHTVLVLEDDVRFEKYFIKKLRHLLDEVHRFTSTWDLM